MIQAILILAILGFQSHAGPYVVQLLDTHFTPQEKRQLAEPHVQIKEFHSTREPSSFLPPVPLRNRVFSESGLAPALRRVSPIDRDALYLRLRQNGKAGIQRALVLVPQLANSLAQLTRAQELIHQYEN